MRYLAVIFLFFANIALAGDVSQFVFTIGPQTIKPNEISEKIYIQAQDVNGPVNIPQTACLKLITSSDKGQFSSSDTTWKSINILTMSRGDTRRGFYYKDSSTGNYKMTVNIALRPTEETRPCASWSVEEWGIKWILTQDIAVLESVSSPEPKPVLEPKTETQQQTTTIIDSQPEPETKQEPAVVTVIENPDSAEQPQSQEKPVIEPDKKPANKNPESTSTTVVEAEPKPKEQNPGDAEFAQTVQAAQVVDAINIGGSESSWSVREWLMIIGGIIVISVAGLFFVRRQSSV